MNLKKISSVFILISSFIFSQNIYSQAPMRSVDLNKQKPSWQAVIGGVAVSPCVDTSYGMAVISDGRLLSACTNHGNVIWQRSVKGRPSPYISSMGDFLYVVTSNSHLNFINPSGMTVWSADCHFDICDKPLPGKDGRVFVRGTRAIACYGLNGEKKWYHDTEAQSSLPISQLSDGSVIVYLAQAKNGRTIGKRFSAFGEELEDLTFTEIVSACTNCPEGILVSLRSGSIGLITVQGEKAETKWVTVSGLNSGAFSICYKNSNHHAAYFFQKGTSTQAVIINVNDGKILNQIPVGNISYSQFKGAKSSPTGFFISGSYSACEFYEDGTIVWSAVLPPSKNWNEMCYTKANYLIFCMKDWSMNGFKMTEAPGTEIIDNSLKFNSLVKVKEMDSVSRQFNLHPLTNEKISEYSQLLKNEDLKGREKEIISDIKSEAQAYLNSINSRTSYRNELSYFDAEPVFTQNLLYLMSRCGTADFYTLYSKILTSETNPQLLNAAITYSGDQGFDPDGSILTGYEYLLLNKLLPKDLNIIQNLCDSTYKVCRFMGRPTFNKQGKNILTRLMFPQYSKETRDYARKTLEKMIELEK